MKNSYTYLIINKLTDMKYIGSRSCKALPIEDLGIKYFSSSKDKDFIKDQKNNRNDFEYIILKEFDNRKDAIKHEVYLHNLYDVGNNPEYYNRAKQTSTGFDTTGKVPVKDKFGNNMQVSLDDPRYLNGDLIIITKGKVTVKDKDGNTMQVSTNDPRYLNGDLVHNTKGKVTVKDGNMLSISTNDPRYLSCELRHMNLGYVSVKDKDGNTMQVSTNDPRYLNGDLVHVNAGTIAVKDKENNKIRVSKDDPRYLNGDLIGHTGFWYEINNQLYSLKELISMGYKNKEIMKNRFKNEKCNWQLI